MHPRLLLGILLPCLLAAPVVRADFPVQTEAARQHVSLAALTAPPYHFDATGARVSGACDPVTDPAACVTFGKGPCPDVNGYCMGAVETEAILPGAEMSSKGFWFAVDDDAGFATTAGASDPDPVQAFQCVPIAPSWGGEYGSSMLSSAGLYAYDWNHPEQSVHWGEWDRFSGNFDAAPLATGLLCYGSRASGAQLDLGDVASFGGTYGYDFNLPTVIAPAPDMSPPAPSDGGEPPPPPPTASGCSIADHGSFPILPFAACALLLAFRPRRRPDGGR
jgi:hypothetical protein